MPGKRGAEGFLLQGDSKSNNIYALQNDVRDYCDRIAAHHSGQRQTDG
jgi:hypothetical protein